MPIWRSPAGTFGRSITPRSSLPSRKAGTDAPCGPAGWDSRLTPRAAPAAGCNRSAASAPFRGGRATSRRVTPNRLRASLMPVSAVDLTAMTSREKLHLLVDELTDAEAAATLARLLRDRERLDQWANSPESDLNEDAWALANAREAIREERW